MFSRDHVLEALRAQIQACESGPRRAIARPIRSGCEPLDGLVFSGTFHTGQLVEWLSLRSGSGVGTLAFWLARQAAAGGIAAGATVSGETVSGGKAPGNAAAGAFTMRTVVVMDRAKQFYPPAALAWKMDPGQLLIIRPTTAADTIWALDQTLRCPAVAAVWAPLERIAPRDFRRLQLAAEQGNTLGLLLRPATVRGEPTWSDLQLLVEPISSPAPNQTHVSLFGPSSTHFPRAVPCRRPSESSVASRWRVQLLRCRSGTAGKTIVLEMDAQTGTIQASQKMVRQAKPCQLGSSHHETCAVPLAAQLARPASSRRSARA